MPQYRDVSSGDIPAFGNCGEMVNVGLVIVGVIVGGTKTTVVVANTIGVLVAVVVTTGLVVVAVVVVATVDVATTTGVTTGGTAATHTGFVTVLESTVTAPLRASTRPSTFAPVVIVVDVKETMVPLKIEFVPSVAELPTCQMTLQACAPLRRTMELAPAVVSVEADLNIKTASGSFCASRVSVPVIANEPSTDS